MSFQYYHRMQAVRIASWDAVVRKGTERCHPLFCLFFFSFFIILFIFLRYCGLFLLLCNIYVVIGILEERAIEHVIFNIKAQLCLWPHPD